MGRPARQTGDFGALPRRYRVVAGLSQEQLAEHAGISRRGIADLERGARRLEVKTFLLDGQGAALEAEFVAHHGSEFAGKPASGREVRVPYTVIYDVAADRISVLRIYGFMDVLLRQL